MTRSLRPLGILAALAGLLCGFLPLLPLGKALLDPAAWEILTSTRLQGLFLQTLGMSLGAAGVAFLVGLPFAFLASRTRCWGGSGAWLLLPWPLLVPPLLIAQAWHGLTGIDGIAGAAITLGLAYAPFPALFTRFALTQQSRSSHEAALLLGGPRLALQKSLAYAIPGALFGASLAFLFAAMDFAVPDYLAAVGNKFSVYAAEVFNSWRSQNYLAGVTTAVPLVLLAGFLLTLSWGLLDRYSTQEDPNSQIPRPLELKGIGRVGHGVLWLCTSLVLLLPFGRILWETGAAGPLAEGTWFERSTASFADALDRGRLDLLRTMRTGLIAALVTLLLAPPLAMSLATMRSKRWARAVRVLLALPLLTPAVAMGLGAILVWNQPLTGSFYDSFWLPPLLFAGRFLPIAVFLLEDRFRRTPAAESQASQLAGIPAWRHLYLHQLQPHRGTWLLAAGLVAAFAMRELDMAVLLPAANPSAAVRYYNALHFARDGFVAAFGLCLSLILILPALLHAASRQRKPS